MTTVAILDANAYNLAMDPEFLTKVEQAVSEGTLTILQTHVERDQIGKAPGELREKMLAIPTEPVPTSHFIVGYSRVGHARVSSNSDYDEERGNATAEGPIKDAIIAATARTDADILVSDDKRHLKRTDRFAEGLTVLSTQDFEAWLDDSLE